MKDFFDKNRNSFNDLELPDGHEERFLSKLNKTKKNSLKTWYRIAAGILLVASISLFAKEHLLNPKVLKGNEIELSDISPEYQEVERFYKTGVNEKIEEIEKLQCKIDNEQKAMINKELEQLNKSYHNLQSELENNRNDERIINAMITNYQNRINFLEQVIFQIKENC